ncbi:helicase associated domain-containing protein [Salinibacterium xinjiangense]|uniref:helicase associated domain-containing protein n=1 Tax=Salinibacterium xinjiangense TaxID=386302 RepID=UPI00117B88DF
MANFEALAQFVSTNFRFPASSQWPSTHDELRLAGWLREQRRHQLRLAPERVTLLESLNNFEWRPHDDAWDRQLQRWIDFVNEHQREPMYAAPDIAETRIAAWAIRQRYLRRLRRLPKHRLDRLAETPSWHWL